VRHLRFSWLMKGFFGIAPYGICRHDRRPQSLGAFVRVATPRRYRRYRRLPCCAGCSPGTVFVALILTGKCAPSSPLSVQLSPRWDYWNLMAATAVMALLPAFLVALFGQKYDPGFTYLERRRD
jgi:multiple sugar transport system permease protein